MFLPSLAFFCIGVLRVGGVDLPSYIPKCSLSDPNVNQCIVEKANACIPRLMQGDSALAIPCLSPLNVSDIVMEGDDLVMEWFGVYTDAMKNFRMINASFDLTPGRNSSYAGYVNHMELRGENYNILSGNVVGIPAYGNGKFVITIVGFTINIVEPTTSYERDGEIYINLGETEATVSILYANYYFENIKSPCVDDVNAYIEEHVEEFTKQLEPALREQFRAYSNYAMDMLTTKLSVNKMFLP